MGYGKVVIVGLGVEPNNLFWNPIVVWQGMCQCDGGAEAFDRSVNVSAEEDTMAAIGEQDQGSARTRSEYGETGIA